MGKTERAYIKKQHRQIELHADKALLKAKNMRELRKRHTKSLSTNLVFKQKAIK